MSPRILLMAVTLVVLPIHAALPQEVEDKAKGEQENSAVDQDVRDEHEAEGKKTDKVKLKIKEIVVTGDKIGRSTVEAPPSITIIEGEQAEQPINRDIKQVIRKAANVFVEEGLQRPSVRGVDGSGGQNEVYRAGVQPRVPILIDDMPRPLHNAFSVSRSSTWDVSTVEIARGPQPSSTGRNALGGAIRIYTNNPTFDYEAAARLRAYTTNGTGDAALMANLPLIDDQVALRLTAEESQGRAYINVVGGTENIRGNLDPEEEYFRRFRGKVLMTPAAIPGLELKFTVDHMRTRGPIPGWVDADGNPKNFTLSHFAAQASLENNNQTTYSGRASYLLNEFAMLELRGSFVDNELLYLDTGSGIGEFGNDLDQVEGEAFLRLSDVGVLKRGLVGVIHNTSTEDSATDTDAFPLVTEGEIHNTGFYAEAEIGLDRLGLMNGLTLIAGGRYERDDRSRAVSLFNSIVSDRDRSVRRFQPKVGVRYAPTNDLMLGYTYSESFRAGGTDVDITSAAWLPYRLAANPLGISNFDPETLRHHELYGKVSLWNRRLALGASAFYYTYDDGQVPGAAQALYRIVDPATGGERVEIAPMLGNMPEAIGYGVELEGEADLTNGLSMNGALGFLKTEMTDTGPALRAVEGRSLPRAPSTTASLALNYESGLGFKATFSGRFIGRTTSLLNGPPIPSYTLFDLSLGYVFLESSFGRFRVDASIENLTDRGYFTFRQGPPFPSEAKGRPRTFLFSATWRF